MADDVQVRFGASIGELISGVEAVKDAILSIAEPVAAVKESLIGLGEGFAAAFAIEKVSEFFRGFAEIGDQTAKFAALLGTSTEEIGGLDIAARSSGTSLQGLVGSMERLGLSLAKADGGSRLAKAGLDALGISAKEFEELSPSKQLEELADKFSVLKDGIEKTAVAQAVMGRAGAENIPLFNKGKEGLQEMADIAERTASAWQKDLVGAWEKTNGNLVEMDAAFRGVGLVLATELKPAFDGTIKVLTDMAEAFIKAAKEGGAMKVLLDGMSAAVRGLATAFAVTISSVETLWTVSKETGALIVNTWNTMGKAMAAAMTLNFQGVKDAAAELRNSMVTNEAMATRELRKNWEALYEQLKVIWGKGAADEAKIQQTRKPQLDVVNRDIVAAAMEAAQERIKLADMEYARVAEKLSSEAKLHIMTESQKTAATLAALDERLNKELMALSEEQAIQGLSLARYQKILDERKTLYAKYLQDQQKLTDQGAQSEAKIWEQRLGTLTGAFNTQLRGLLAGTTTWADASKRILADLVISSITAYETLVVRWVSGELAKTTATVTGVATRTAAEATAGSVGVGQQIANALQVIGADAAKTFSGIFAYLAPVIGPFAAAPAAAGAAVVLASEALIPKAETGGWVLGAGLASVHPGEAIVPANLAQPFGGGGIGGGGQGGTVNFHISTMDQNGVNKWVNDNKALISRVVFAHMNSQPGSFAR